MPKLTLLEKELNKQITDEVLIEAEWLRSLLENKLKKDTDDTRL